MSFENKLHAVLLVAFVALASATFVTTALDNAATVAKAKTTQVASASAAPRASR